MDGWHRRVALWWINTNLLCTSNMDAPLQICSKASCKKTLPPSLPGQRVYKTCESCRISDQKTTAERRKRKRGELTATPENNPDGTRDEAGISLSHGNKNQRLGDESSSSEEDNGSQVSILDPG